MVMFMLPMIEQSDRGTSPVNPFALKSSADSFGSVAKYEGIVWENMFPFNLRVVNVVAEARLAGKEPESELKDISSSSKYPGHTMCDGIVPVNCIPLTSMPITTVDMGAQDIPE